MNWQGKIFSDFDLNHMFINEIQIQLIYRNNTGMWEEL
jgi:hypothetical protein